MTRDVAVAVDVRSRLMQDLVRNQSSSMESVKTMSRTVNTETRQTRDSSAGASSTHESNYAHKASQINDTAQDENTKVLISQKALVETEKRELLSSNLELKNRLLKIEQDLLAERQTVEHLQKIAAQQSKKQYKSQSVGPAVTHITTSISTSTYSLNVISSKTVNERSNSASSGANTIEVLPIRSSSSNELVKTSSMERLGSVREMIRKTNSITNKMEKSSTTTSTTSQHIKLVPSNDTSIVYVPNGSNVAYGASKLQSALTAGYSESHHRDSRTSSNSSLNGKNDNDSNVSLRIHMSSTTTPANGSSRNEVVKIPIVKEDVRSKSNDFFITNVTVTKPPISPSRSLSRESRQEGQQIQGALTNERFITESSELVTYKDGEVVEKRLVEK